MAVNLDGVDDFLTAPFSTDYELPGDFTISIKVNFGSLSGINKRGLFSLGRGANANATTGGGANGVVSAWWLRTEPTSFGLARYEGFDNSTFLEYYRNFTFSTNTPYTITASRIGSTLSLYVDANQVGSSFTTTAQFTQVSGGAPQPLTIGRVLTGDPSQQSVPPNYASYVNGQVSEAAIWKGYGLTASEIAALAGGFTPAQVRIQNLVFYAPLIRDIQDLRNGAVITNNNGATVTTHPRIYT